MTRPIQLDKTYGVLHTENYFSFLGFAKKVGSDEIQKIDVFLDDKLIDTIEANEFIQKIDDMYDVESKAFTYNLPTQYIGKKAIISFKNHDSGEELLNSPYTLIDKNHEKFNEAKFLHSLSEPLSEELKNMYKPNCVGFLATKENLEDEEFVEYVNEIIKDFPEYDFKALYFDKNSIKEIKNKFQHSNLNLIELKSAKDLINLNEAKLSKMKIIAPFSGVISEKNIEIGDMSNNSEKALLKLVSNEKKLLLAFDSKFAQDVKVGDKFCINSNKEENKTCVEIYKVYPTLNSEKKLNAEAFGVDLKVGNFGDGSIIKGN